MRLGPASSPLSSLLLLSLPLFLHCGMGVPPYGGALPSQPRAGDLGLWFSISVATLGYPEHPNLPWPFLTLYSDHGGSLPPLLLFNTSLTLVSVSSDVTRVYGAATYSQNAKWSPTTTERMANIKIGICCHIKPIKWLQCSCHLTTMHLSPGSGYALKQWGENTGSEIR